MVADTAVDMKEHMVADMEVNKVADIMADKKDVSFFWSWLTCGCTWCEFIT